MTDLLTIGERIAALRIASGLSQRELGEKIGRSRSSVAQVEAGGMKPDYEFIKGVVKVCGGTYEYIIEDPGESKAAISVTPNIVANENSSVGVESSVSKEQKSEVRFKPENAASGNTMSQKQNPFADLSIEGGKTNQQITSNRLGGDENTTIQANPDIESLRELIIRLTSELEKIELKNEARHKELLRKFPTLIHETVYDEA